MKVLAEVGDWYAPCCVEDLQRLDTADAVAEAQALLDEGIGQVFPSLERAAAVLMEKDDDPELWVALGMERWRVDMLQGRGPA